MIAFLSRLVVAASGPVLVASAESAPSGDVQLVVDGVGECRAEVPDLVAGRGIIVVWSSVSLGVVLAMWVVVGCRARAAVMARKAWASMARGPAVPGGPGADLVFVQAGAALAGLESSPRPASGSGHPHQCRERDGGGGVVEELGQLTGVQIAPQQQPAVMGRLSVADAGEGPSVESFAFTAAARGQDLPAVAWDLFDELVGA